MYLRHCARVSVTGCIAEPREASAGIKVQGIYERAEIAGCSVTGGGIGIAGTDCYDYRIVGNSIRDATSEGIKLAIDQESTARFLVISNNTISNCTFGIWAQNIQGVSGSGNHFRDCGTGIRFKGVRGGMLSATFMELTSNTSNPSNSEGAVTFLLFEKPNVSPNPESPPTYNECNFSGLSIRNGRAGTGVTIAKNIGTVEHPSTLEDAKYLIFDGVSVIGSFAATWLNINPPPESPNEGSFAPTLIGGATAGEGTYTTQAGRWQRVGSRCNFEINLSWSAHTGSGELIVDALPFVASSTLGAYPVRFYWRDIAITSGSQLIGYVIGGEKRIRLRLLPASGAPAALQVPASGSLDIAGSYIVQG
nr:right-handed parallel beta-helix repeat-containing protein [Methylosinus sp. Sm6]